MLRSAQRDGVRQFALFQSRYFSPVVLVLVCALASANIWLGPGIINTRAGGDSPFLLIRTYELANNLRAGIFPARWMPDAAFGLGYPFFNFYAALPYYLAAGLNVLGVDLLTAIKLTQTVGLFVAAGAMLLFARTMLPNWGATLAAAAYALAPFHLVNVYVRGDSLSEFWAFVWYPLILWVIHEVVTQDSRFKTKDQRRTYFIFHLSSFILRLTPYVLVLSLSLACLVLTHNVSALIFAPFIVIYSLALLIRHAARAKDFVSSCSLPSGMLALRMDGEGRGAVPLALAAVLLLALSAWFWLPALGEASSMQLSDQTTGYFNYANHFRGVNLIQPSLLFDYAVNQDGDAFAMGLLQAALIVVGALVWLISNQRARQSNFSLVLMMALFLLSTFMITPLSEFIWQRAPLLPLTQFPWRFLSVQAVFASVLIGGIGKYGIENAELRIEKPFSQFSISNLFILILAVSALLRLPNERLNILAEDVTPHTIQLYEWHTGNIGTTIRAEYLPMTARPHPLTSPDLLGRPRRALIARDGVAPDAVSSRLESHSPTQQVWRINANESLSVTLPLLYSPAWRATLDGALVNLSAYSGSGWSSLLVPEGEHRVVLDWQGTPLERASELTSLIAIFVVVVLIVVAIVRASSVQRRSIAFVAAVLAVCLGGLVLLTRILRTPSTVPAIQTLDYERRPFPHRDPVQLRSNDGATYELIGAALEPQQVRAGETVTLQLRWRDDRAPQSITVTQELPHGGEFIKLFRYAREQTRADSRETLFAVLSNTLPGPTLLKLQFSDPFGNALQPIASDGSLLNTNIAGKPVLAVTILGPTIIDTPHNAPATHIVEFDNGIALSSIDWFFASASEVCFRPQWTRVRHDVNRADALQVSLRLLGSDGRLITKREADSQPQGGLAPTWAWPDGVLINDSQCVPTNGVLEPNEPYTLQIVWYRLASLQPTGEATLRGIRGSILEAINVPAP